MCVLIQLTTIYVSSLCYKCVLILLYTCPHTTIYVSSYYYMSENSCRIYYRAAAGVSGAAREAHAYARCVCYICVRIPHTAIYVSAYDYQAAAGVSVVQQEIRLLQQERFVHMLGMCI